MSRSFSKNADRHPILSSRDIFFRCVEDSNEPIMITDLGGKIIYVNPAWTTCYEYTYEEAMGETPRLLRSVYQDKEFYQAMWEKIRNPEVGYWKGELINRSKSGVEVPVLLSITPYRRQEDSEIQGYMAVALSLKENKELAEQVKKQDRLATIGELTSGLAHEIGTPIGVIRGRAEMLKMEVKDNPAQSKSLDIMIKQIDRISSLISTLLRLSKKKEELGLTQVSCSRCIEEVWELFEHKLNKIGIIFECNLEDDLRVIGDFERLEQVAINLIVNSIHAIEERSEKEKDFEKKISITGWRDAEGSVVVSFKDTGKGIPPGLLSKIFDPFFTTKPTSKGTGLGLSIVSRLVEEMGGRIQLPRQPDQGAEFLLRFRST